MRKNFGKSTAYSCITNLFTEFKLSFSQVFLNKWNLWVFINCYGKVRPKKKFTYRVKILVARLCVLPKRNPRIKQKLRGAVAGKKEHTEG